MTVAGSTCFAKLDAVVGAVLDAGEGAVWSPQSAAVVAGGACVAMQSGCWSG